MKLLSATKSILLTLFLTISLLVLNSCSKNINFLTSSVVPAARGYAKIKMDRNKNYNISVSLSNLAEVERLDGNKKTYVVWMESSNENAKNIGQIMSNTNKLSKKLNASFNTVSSAKPTKIFITAEQDGSVQYSSNIIVLTTGAI